MSKSIFSFFSGAGLLDLGFEQSKYNIVLVNEYNSEFLRAYEFARSQKGIHKPKCNSYCCDINEFLSGEKHTRIHQYIEVERKLGNLIGFIGGPPCPDFSVGGKNKGREGVNGALAQSYVNLIIDCSPDFFVFENVKGLIKTAKHREYYNELKQQLQTAGYVIADKLLNSLCFGVPQDRERIILIGIKREMQNLNKVINDKNEIEFPWFQNAVYNDATTIKNLEWPTRQPFSSNISRRQPRAIKEYSELAVETWFRKNDVEDHPNGSDTFKVKSGLPKISTIEEGDVSRKSFKRLHRWRYSPTAAYGNNEVHLHPYKIRRLSVAETMAIQSLPEWFVLPADMSLTNKFKVIGNGVPVLMAKAIAETLNDLLDSLKEINND
ncbi:MAG: DNA cytosine methyltransferase [Clostridiales bacterium]|nr:DNA cytosine methyltransferase [Clostridiales bacterium]